MQNKLFIPGLGGVARLVKKSCFLRVLIIELVVYCTLGFLMLFVSYGEYAQPVFTYYKWLFLIGFPGILVILAWRISVPTTEDQDSTTLVVNALFGAASVCIILLGCLILLPTPPFSCASTNWQMWESSDKNARIIDCSSFAGMSHFSYMNRMWRPATEEELYKYKDEFPRTIDGFVYAGGSLIFGEDPRSGAHVPYVLGYAPVGYYFFPALTPLEEVYGDKLQLIIRRQVPIEGRLEEYAGERYSLGFMEIPKKSDIRH